MSSRSLLTLTLSLALAACQQRLPSPDVIAEIAGRAVVYDQFESYLEESSFDPGTVVDSRVLSALLDQMLDERLLWRLAVDELPEGSSLGPREAIERLLHEAVREQIDNAEIAQFYRLHQERFQQAERILMRQVLLNDPVVAADLRQIWAWGAPYEEIVDRVSETPEAHLGQEGEFELAELPKSFADYLFSLEDGAVSDVLATDYGFHVIQVVAHLPAAQEDLDHVEQEIREEILQKRLDEELERLVGSARERYNVRVFVRNVPFNYEGIYDPYSDETSG